MDDDIGVSFFRAQPLIRSAAAVRLKNAMLVFKTKPPRGGFKVPPEPLTLSPLARTGQLSQGLLLIYMYHLGRRETVEPGGRCIAVGPDVFEDSCVWRQAYDFSGD
jgi:hypothetical protein